MTSTHPEVLDEIAQLNERRGLDVMDLQIQLERAAFFLGRVVVLAVEGNKQIQICKAQAEAGEAGLQASLPHIDASIAAQRMAGFDSEASRSGRKAYRRTMHARRELDDHIAAYAGLLQHLNTARSFEYKVDGARSLLERLFNEEGEGDVMGRLGPLQRTSEAATDRTVAYIERRDKESEAEMAAQGKLQEADQILVPPDADPANPMPVLRKMIEVLTATSKGLAEVPDGIAELQALVSTIGADIEAFNNLLAHWQGAAPMPAALSGVQGNLAELAASLAVPVGPEAFEEHVAKVTMGKAVFETVAEMTTQSQDLRTSIKQRLHRAMDGLKAYVRRGGGR